MTKEKKQFIDYLDRVEDASREYQLRVDSKPDNIHLMSKKGLIDLKKEFYEWFNKITK